MLLNAADGNLTSDPSFQLRWTRAKVGALDAGVDQNELDDVRCPKLIKVGIRLTHHYPTDCGLALAFAEVG